MRSESGSSLVMAGFVMVHIAPRSPSDRSVAIGAENSTHGIRVIILVCICNILTDQLFHESTATALVVP
jgi:hypothetical protein